MATAQKSPEEAGRLAASLRALEGVLSAGLKAVLSECARNRAWALPAGLPSAQQERLALARAAFDYHVHDITVTKESANYRIES